MRLLHVDSLELTEVFGDSPPPYTILSHTWGLDEITFHDLQNDRLATRVGFIKLRALCDQTKRDGFEYTWIDTCCIDKRSSAELSESLNSMYQWYSKAEVCYVHLSDVRYTGDETDITRGIHHSRWFTRSWTLQELLAPSLVVFFDTSWNRIGTKKSLLSTISAITEIPQSCLSGERSPADFSIATRFSWASRRTCTRQEDMAYSLMGLFNVNMTVHYGERNRAFFRLQEEIIKHTDDQSILAWAVSEDDSRYFTPSSVFAESPADFATAAIISRSVELEPSPFILTNSGLSISLPFAAKSADPTLSLMKDSNSEELTEIRTAYLNCEAADTQHTVQIALMPLSSSSSATSSSASFYRLATPLMLGDRSSHLDYKSIYISLGLGGFSQSRRTAPYPEKQVQESPHSYQRAMLPDPMQDTSQTDSSFVRGISRPKESMMDAVADTLNDQMVTNIAGRLFLPEGILNEVLDEYAMSRLLQDLLPTRSYATETFEGTLLLRCRKIFAILILSGLLKFFRPMVYELGISDECLPMPDPVFLTGTSRMIGNNETKYLGKWKSVTLLFERKFYTRMFFEKQWCVLAPIFKNRDDIEHYSLTPNHILPFVQSPRGTPGTDMEDSDAQNRLELRRFNVIRRVSIHPDHHHFVSEFVPSGKNFMPTSNCVFAVKELLGANQTGFLAERRAMQRLVKPGALNILPLLATYEVHSNDIHPIPITYNMLLPWADEDLKKFWESERYFQDEHIVPWIAEQCWKLADALRVIHIGYMEFGSSVPGNEHLYGLHGDIKPANILRFVGDSRGQYGALGQLVIGDFGLSQFHHEETKSNISSSKMGYSDTYSAPEFLVTQKISQKIDIWALGCIFLEFITWFLMGPDSVNRKFRDLRVEADMMLVIQSDKFFQAVPHDDGRPPVAKVKPVVLQWMNALRNNDGCSLYFDDLLDLVDSRMLVVGPHERIQADTLSQRLEEMYKKCLQTPQYYQSHSSPRRREAESVSRSLKSQIPLKKSELRPRRVCSFMRKLSCSPSPSHQHAKRS